MYNLLMLASSGQNQWQENQGRSYDVRFLKGRVFEFTEDAIAQTFDGPNFEELMKLPCLFTYEGTDVVGSIGCISDVKVDNGKFEITYTLPDAYPRIALSETSVFEALGIGVERSFERSRTHWAVKDVDLFEVTTRLLHERPAPTVVLSNAEMTRIWGDEYRRKKLVFLSHRAEHRRHVSEVKTELESQGLRCFLAHQDIAPSRIWQDEILNALNTMHIFIGFLTNDFHGGAWTDQEIGYAFKREVPRMFVKLGDGDPQGMVAREQALTAGWDTASQAIIAHLQAERISRR